MPKLEEVVKGLNKKFSVGEIKLGVEFTEVPRIHFSSLRLNYMTYGGLPVGRIIEFFGADGSGKTTTALDIAGQAQKLYPDKKVLICDIEHTFDTEWATKLGVDVESILYFDPDSMGAEEVFNILIELVDSGEISVCVLDSIGAMVSNQANEKQIGERTYGGISMALTEFSKKITPILARTQSMLIAINQVRDDMNSMYGGTTTTGGRAFRHACSVRMEFRKGNYIDEKGNNLSRACENPAGNLVNVALIKTKICKPDRKVGFYTLNYLTGIDYVSDLIDVAVKTGVIQKAGAWFSILDDTGEVMKYNDEPLKFQGQARLSEYLKENYDIYEMVLGMVEDLIA